jgi:hypothetical protein
MARATVRLLAPLLPNVGRIRCRAVDSIPIFEGGQLRGVLALRESRQREAAVFFQERSSGPARRSTTP